MRRTAAIIIGLGLTATGLVGCGSSSSQTDPSTSSSTLSGSITVFAAASLTESFTTLGKQFEAANPGVKVTFSFAASSALATQITNGAPADVFASASQKNMDQVVSAGDAADPTTFVKNVMEIAVPAANPAHVATVQDLAKAGVKVALCQPQVPCGSTAQKVFTKAGVTVTPVTQEPDVKAVLSKVALGEVDAGMVYVTDVRSAGSQVTGVPIPADINASTSYPIATVSNSANLAAARAFVAYVLSPAGATVLAGAGFEKP